MSNPPGFEAWLQTLPALGYDYGWIRRNSPALKQRYEQTDGAPMSRCPQAPEQSPSDRYEEL